MESEFPIKEEAVSPSFEAIFDQFTNEEVENSRQNSTTSSLESNESEDLEFYLSHQNEEFYSEYKETSPTKIRESNQDLEQENYLESNLSDSQQSNVKSILDSVNALSHLEKLFLYLKLPSRQSESLIISNNKKEQTKAFKWIRENMEETDSSANIPKHEVYEKYRHDIEKRGDKLCLSAPDFGKIIKCIFPNVKARRLGTRGNSKYCYSGLRTKQGEVYEINNNRASSSSSSIEQTVSAASSLICEWAEKLLGRVFTTIIELAKFLVAGSYVSSKSMSAFVVMSASQDTVKTVNQRYSSVYAVKAPKSDKPIKLESSIKESIPPQVVPHTPKREVKTEAEECVVLNTPPPSTHKSTANIQQQQHLKQQQQQIRLQQLNQQQLKQPQQSNRQQQLNQQQLIQQQRQQPTTVNQHLNQQQQQILQTSITSQLKQHQAQGLDRKKKPEKLPLPKVHSSPSRKTPKKTSRQSRSIKTTPYSSPQPNIQQLSLLQQQQIINSQFSQFYPLQNRAIVWQQQPPPSGLVSPSTVELQSIFQQVTAAPPQPFNRCHSVPAPPRTTTAQHPSFMPLTPQHRSGQQKARRNLTNIFNNNAVVPQQQIVHDFAKLCGQLTSQQQLSFQQPPANNIIGFDLNDLSTPDELSDLVYPPFEHVDSEELINSLQTDAMR